MIGKSRIYSQLLIYESKNSTYLTEITNESSSILLKDFIVFYNSRSHTLFDPQTTVVQGGSSTYSRIHTHDRFLNQYVAISLDAGP